MLSAKDTSMSAAEIPRTTALNGNNHSAYHHGFPRLDRHHDSRAEAEVAGVNINTPSREFHGQTSSMAFLAALNSDTNSPDMPQPRRENGTLVSTFYNGAFMPAIPKTTPDEDALLRADNFYFKYSALFLESHFQNIHFVHPILDKATFMSNCEDLWFGRSDQQSRSFVALYYSIMSLGALVRSWDDDETIDGKDRLHWSRKLFDLACIALVPSRMNADLETIQTCLFLAKVCQNLMNPSLAYIHLGLATRLSFAAGINRQPRSDEAFSSHAKDMAAQRTWWALYALEVELSFALGRPDSLGPDQYHNVELPQEDTTEIAIIPALVYFARIIRKVCTSIYLSNEPLDIKVDEALRIEKDLDHWIAHLPDSLRPSIDPSQPSSKITKESRRSKLQRLVLSLRYYNVKMILFRPFLGREVGTTQRLSPVLSAIVHRCVDAGRVTITHMHDVFINQPFFRNWWNNTTYVMYAASTVLWYTVNTASAIEIPALLDLADKAIDILEAMDESVVAQKARRLIEEVVSKAREKLSADAHSSHDHHHQSALALPSLNVTESLDRPQEAGAAGDISLQGMDLNLDFLDMTFPMDEMQSAFWTDDSSQLI